MTYLVLIANADDSTISALRFDAEAQNTLTVLSTSPGGKGNATFAIDSERNLVYVAAKPASEGAAPQIVTLALDRATGGLTEKARIDVEAPLAYLALAHGGTLLVGASYHGGFGAVWPVTPGGLGEPTGRVDHNNVHCCYVDGDRVYFVALGDDLVAQCHLGADGELLPLEPATVAAPEGSGPRHLVTSGSNAYLMTEYSGEVIRFDIDGSGRLTAAESVNAVDPNAGLKHSRFGADPEEEHLIWGADVHVAGEWVLASERMASTIASISTDGGKLGEVAHLTTTEKQPRGFAVTPDGRHAIVVGEKSTTARVYRVEADGALADVGSAEIGSGPNWVRIIEE